MATQDTPRRSLNLKEMLDELPMLSTTKGKKWTKNVPLKIFAKDDKSAASPSAVSPIAPAASSPSVPLLSSPRQKMASMSVLVPKSDEEIVSTLDPRFFTESFDAVGYMLENLPPSREELDQFLQTEISAVDLAKDVIMARLADDVRENYSSFIQGMNQVQEVDLDLVRAQIHVKNGRRLLMAAKNDLIIRFCLCSLEIIKTKRNRDRVQEIIRFGDQILKFFDEEAKMNQALQDHSFTTAVDICITLRDQLSLAHLHDVSILKNLGNRIQDFIPKLHKQFDTSLRKVAEQFDPLKYKELLLAYITLAEHSENLGFDSNRLSSVLSNIPEIVVRCIDDITRQFLEERFYQAKVSPKKPKSTKTNRLIKRGKQNDEDVVVADTQTAAATTASASQTIEYITRSYERLTELMHTYYLLVQWHRDPFHPNNDDLVYLHRCGIDDDDDNDSDEEDENDNDDNEHHNNASSAKILQTKAKRLVSPRRRRGSSVSSEPGSNNATQQQQQQRSLYNDVLCKTGMTLLRYRKILWENMQQNMLEVLERLDVTYGYKMEHIIALSHATSTFIEIGEELTGTPTTKLRTSIRIKCEQYLNAFHDDNIELTRMLLDTENWQRVTTSLEGGDNDVGLLRLIEKRSGYVFQKKLRADLTVSPIYARRVFPSFHTNGNPFSAANSMEWLSLKKGIRFQHEQRSVSSGNCVEDITQSNHAEPEAEGVGVFDKQIMNNLESEFVLNSSTLAGFVRFCGVYLKMMEHLPHMAWDSFLLLNKLFEFNVYAVFSSFVDRDVITQLLTGQQKGWIGDGMRWNGLRNYICRIAEELEVGELLLQSSALLYPNGVDAATKTSASIQPTVKKITLRLLTRIPAAVENADPSNLHALVERSIACEAIVGQARLLNAIEPFVRSYLADRYHCLMDEVYERNRIVAKELRSFMYSTISVTLVDVPSLLRAIAQVNWDFSYICEQHNDYIVQIVRRCGEAWGGLQIFADGSIPVDAREEIWAAMVQVIMETLLIGFSTVERCTPQGRALMSMDLHALTNGLDLINHISRSSVPHGREYVSNYIKAFYYDEADLLSWIEANKDLYTKLHFVNLIKNGIGASMKKMELRELVLKIEAILS